MRKHLNLTVFILAVALVVGSAPVASADYDVSNTPIGNILAYKNGLDLSEKQIAKLEKFNDEIANEICAVQTELEIRKAEVEQFMADWSTVHGTATHHLIGEYYELQAKLRQLELEAIMKARGVLTIEQMKQYVQLASVEALNKRLDAEYASAY